jgi:hypothetical protein
MATDYDITIETDRDYYFPVSIVTYEQNPANLSGYTCVMTIKKSIGDPDSSALFKSGPWSQNLPFGQFSFKVPRATSKGWWLYPPSGSGPVSTAIVYDVAVQDVAQTPNWTTLLSGSVTILPAVTQSIP